MDPQTVSLVSTQGFSALTMVGLLEWLKTQKWFPLLESDSVNKVKWLWAAIASVITAAGITFKYDPATGTAVITGLTVSLIVHALQQYVLQWFLYRVVKISGNGKNQVIAAVKIVDAAPVPPEVK